ncbi:MAG: tetratricopeptide repeat protein [Sandaracinus sp.]|nr:tetratricopeptide repeat protein [Sandaracinus sp.]
MRSLLVLGLLLVASRVGAQSVEAAESLYRRGDLPGALEGFDAALRAGGLEGSALARVHWHLGVLHAIVGEVDAARADFGRALAIDPSLAVPDELPPEKQALFEEVRRTTRRAELHVEPVAIDANADSTLRVRAPAGLVSRTVLECTPPGGEPWTVEVDGDEALVPSPAWRGARRLGIRAVAFDAHGNVVARTTSTLVAATVGVTEPDDPSHAPSHYALPTEPPRERSVAKSPWLWLGVGAVVIGGVVAAVLVATRDTRYFVEPEVTRADSGLVLTWP